MNTHTNRTLTAAFALALAVGLTACGTDGDVGDGVNPDGPTAVETTDETTEEATTDEAATETTDDAAGTDSGAIDDLTAAALQAIDTAEAEAGGTAYEIDDQDDDGTWEVDVAVDDRSIEVTVSADGLTVVEVDDDDDLDDDDRAGLAAATITLQDAITTAVDEVNGVLDDAELEEDDGTHYWEVSVDRSDRGDDVDVKIDVTNGEVIEIDD